MIQETIADIMSNQVISTSIETTLDDVYILFKENAINNIPVVQNQRPVGIINRIALIQQLSLDRYYHSLTNPIPTKTVGDFMNKNITKLLPDSGIKVAINAIKNDDYKVICVTTPQGNLVGILTLSDLINKYLNFSPLIPQQHKVSRSR